MIRSMSKLIVIVLLIATAPMALGQFDISWFTVGGGGAMSSAGGVFEVSGTIGQPDAQVAPLMSGGSFQIIGGFWPISQVCFCLGDLNGDGKKDGRDVQQFVGCIISAGNCSCADLDQANGVTIADVTMFVSDLLAGTDCP
jgi:hypothetical protein